MSATMQRRVQRSGGRKRVAVDAARARYDVEALLTMGGNDLGDVSGYTTKKGVTQLFLKPLTGKLKFIEPAAFDIESKDADTQYKGFSRPFAVGFNARDDYFAFRNDPTSMCPAAPVGVCGTSGKPWKPLPWPREFLFHRSDLIVEPACERHWWSHDLGRCADLKRRADSRWQERHLDDGGCIHKFCSFLFRRNVKTEGLKGKALKAAREEIATYQARNFKIFGHNAGKFDMLFVLGWLLRHRSEYHFELVAVASRIQQLIVWRAGDSRKRCWVFLDSVSLLPMTLEKVGETFCAGLMVCNTCKGVFGSTKESKVCPRCGIVGELFGKRKMDLDLHEDRPEWDEYLKDDCVVLCRGFLSYQSMIFKLGGEVGITAPATAMKLFRRKFQKIWIGINKHFKSCENKCDGYEIASDGFPKGCSREGICGGECHGCLHEFVRRGYYGGRTEVFRNYVRNGLYFDINSSYPASMLEPMPVGPAVAFGPSNWAYLAQKRKTHIGFVECEVEIPKDCAIPPLPWRVPEGERITIMQPACPTCMELGERSCGHPERETVVPPGKLIFPTGKLTGVWDFDELCLVLHPSVRGKITKVHRSVWFKQERVFADFVNTLYAYRNKDDPANYKNGVIERDPNNPKVILNEDDFNSALAETCKLMLNALYGKFGMREERSGLEIVEHPELGPSVWPENGWPIDGNPETCILWEVDRVVSAPYIIPQISAHITTLSRIRLFYGMVEVNTQDAGVAYVDTDSLTCDKHRRSCDGTCRGCAGTIFEPSHRPACDGDCKSCAGIEESKALGGWKIESPPKELLSAEFILPKLYQLQHHKLDCQWAAWGLGEQCLGCSLSLHRPECKKIKWICENKECGKIHHEPVFDCRDCSAEVSKFKCPGCSATKQKMKGVGGRAQTPENYHKMVHEGGMVEFERLSAYRTMLNTATDEIRLANFNHENGLLLSPVLITARKSVRTRYDKRQLLPDGNTVAIHVAA